MFSSALAKSAKANKNNNINYYILKDLILAAVL